MDSHLLYYGISAVLSLIPVAIWLKFIFRKNKRKSLQLIIFLTGTLTVMPVFALHYFFDLFPQFDIVSFLQSQIIDQNINFVILFISVGIVEEIVKQSIIRVIDKKYLLIQTINESIQFSLISALGFSFIENIFYIYNIWTIAGIEQLFIPYFFRSIFTTCAHMIFSGFFGYYYGIAKFSMDIREQSKWKGKKHLLTTWISRILALPLSQIYKEQMIIKGLFIAIFMHAIFDFLLQLNQIIPVVLFVMAGFLLLLDLLKTKTGRLILVTDIDDQKASSMNKTDEEVVIELVGMWFEEKRYVDVIHICERLLKRDPDNKVVQLFKAQAMDKMDKKSVYTKILQTIFPEKKRTSIQELSEKVQQ